MNTFIQTKAHKHPDSFTDEPLKLRVSSLFSAEVLHKQTRRDACCASRPTALIKPWHLPWEVCLLCTLQAKPGLPGAVSCFDLQ